jgi:hypothetical protein
MLNHAMTLMVSSGKHLQRRFGLPETVAIATGQRF